MSKHGKTLTLALLALLLGAGAATASAADSAPAVAQAGAEAQRSLTSLRIGGADLPVVTLTGSGVLEYESQTLADPDRLVLDLPGTVNRLDTHQVQVGRGGLLRVRAGQYRKDPVPVTRVVFDLDGPVAPRIERDGNDLVLVFGGEPAPDAEPVASAAPAVEPSPSRAVEPDALEQLLASPSLAAEEAAPAEPAPSTFETRTLAAEQAEYTGKKISLNLVDADLKQVFRLMHEISGLNFVLDPSVDGQVTIVLDSVPWDQALDIILKNNGLDKQIEDNVVRIAPTSKLAAEAAARKQLKEAKELEAEPVTVTRTLSYAKAKEVERVIRDGGILTQRGKVIVDERTNTVIVSDIPKRMSSVDDLLSTLDTETPQVMIEARIVETSRSYEQDFGVKWGMNAIADASRGTATNLSFPHNASMKYGLNLPGRSESTLAFKFGNVLDSFTLDLALNALESEGGGRILSSPKIATQNNERAEIEQGLRIPIVNTTATEINVEFVSASLRLAVTPQITAEGTVILDIEVENNQPSALRVGDVPGINTQRAQTKVLISDGGTTVIGGIFQVNERSEEVGVPWFRKIPALGWLFKSRNATKDNTELLIFITPKIMKAS